MTFESNRRLTLLSTVIASLIATLSACGGGGGDSTATSSNASLSTEAAATGALETGSTGTVDDDVVLEGPPAEDSQAASAIPEGFQEAAAQDDDQLFTALGSEATEATEATEAAASAAEAAAPTESAAAYYAPGGAGTTTSTSTNTSTSSVASSDIVQRFRASDINTYKYSGVQCQGTNSYFWEWGGAGAYLRSPLPNPLYSRSGSSFRAFSTVSSPGESGKSAFRWELRRTDPDTAGYRAKRCEFGLGYKLYSYPGKVFSQQIGLPKNKDFWWAVAVNAGDWRNTGSNDTQILWQWHDAYGGGLPPFLSLMTSGNYMWIQLTHDMRSNPSNTTLKRVNPWRISNWTPNKWHRFVVQARKDTVNPSNGFVRIWMNGTQIVNYRGPFGYNVPQMDYAKVGLYHWISSSNTWNSNYPSRVLYTKGPVQVNHRSGYTWQSVNSLLD